MRILPLLPLLFISCTAASSSHEASVQETDADSKYVDTLAINHPEYLPGLPIDTIAPDFGATDSLGQTIHLSDFRGKYVIVDFWATWCGDCRREVPELKQLYEEIGHQHIHETDIQFLSYSFDRDAERWKTFLRKEQFGWPQICTLQAKWHDNPAAQAYRLHWIPAFLLISPDGRLIGKAISVKGLRQAIREVELSH